MTDWTESVVLFSTLLAYGSHLLLLQNLHGRELEEEQTYVYRFLYLPLTKLLYTAWADKPVAVTLL